MNKIFRLPSRLFYDLWDKGNNFSGLTGEKLIAVYSILKSSREKEVKYYSYKSKNNKIISGYSLLRAKTNLSLHVIQKYVPVLIEMGLCFIDKNGDFVLLGNEKVKELYNCTKLVPIRIGRNLIDTADNILSVKLFAAEKQQKLQYKKRLTRSEIIKQGVDPKNSQQLKKAQSVLKRFGDITNLNEKTVLSVEGFAVLKHGAENNLKNIKSSGNYIKRKLKIKGLVKTKRQFEKIQKMSYEDYLNFKKLGMLTYRHTYSNGFLVEEKISSFSPVDLITTKEEKIVEPVIIKSEYNNKPYLEFDMIGFWINGKG